MRRAEAIALLSSSVSKWNEWREANPGRMDLRGADLRDADLSDADLSYANLSYANLSYANLGYANLREANLSEANLHKADLRKANLYTACLWNTALVAVDLSTALGLGGVSHLGPSGVGTDTLVKSRGRIPAKFLRGCGLSPWEIQMAKLYDPALTANQIAEIISTDLFSMRTDGPMYLGGCFISYSHADSKFVDKLYERLKDKGAPVWLDRHDMTAGRMERQVVDAIRMQDAVILVLSEASIASGWVADELKHARRKERSENRDVLCPVALDDAWKAKTEESTWENLLDYNILDFSSWKTKKFDEQFEKLLNGLKLHYPKK